jgi:Glycosyl hydrolases family 28
MKKLSLSRRDLMGRVSRAVFGVPLGPGMMNTNGSTAQQPARVNEGRGVRTLNVCHYGAKGDGRTLDTAAFQAAIDACANDGGGTVLVPLGEFLIGSIELKSNVTFHLAHKAHLLGSANLAHYKRGVERGPYGSTGIIYANDAENISLEGGGTIDGQGSAFRGRAYSDRPFLVLFNGCKNLKIRDCFLTNSAFWCTHFNGCDYVYIDSVRIQSRVNPNNDGLHFDDCRHLQVSNCQIACGDDACALFGSNRHVTITNCTFSTRWSVFRFGEGVSEDITISNCVIYDTFGCPIKMQVGKGTRLENILFSNLVMNHVTGPVYIGLGSPPKNVQEWWNWAPNSRTKALPGGIVRNILFEGIRATIASEPDLKEYSWESPFPGETRTCINLTATDGQFIEDIAFSNIHITFPGGGTSEEAANRQVIQTSGNEYFQFGVLPAFALYARNVRGLRLDNARFDLSTPDRRPALVFDHVEDAAVNGFSARGNAEAESLLRFTDTRQTLLTACQVLSPCSAFLGVEGPASAGITIAACDLSKATPPLVFSRGAGREAVRVSS